MSLTLDTSRLLAACLGLFCGAGLYLALVNRVLSHLRDGPLKSTFMPLALLVCLGGLAVFGYLAGSSTWSAILAVILGWMAAAEVRHRRQKRLLSSDPPVEVRGRKPSLLRPLTTYDLQVQRYQAELPGWRAARLRIAHLSDLHLHAGSPQAFFRATMQLVNEAQPDLLFITGDFVADRHGPERLAEILQPLTSRLGKFAILGNHDYWTDPHNVTEVLEGEGFTVLDGSQACVVLDGEHQLALSGCSAPWSRQSCRLAAVSKGIPHLVLSHTADHIYALSQQGAAAVFSGHYHAGQMQLPWFGPLIVPSLYGRRFHQGHFKVRGTHLFVSAGLGASHPPLRIYCPPDILLVDFSGSQQPQENSPSSSSST